MTNSYLAALEAEENAIVYCKECGQGRPQRHECGTEKRRVELHDPDGNALLWR